MFLTLKKILLAGQMHQPHFGLLLTMNLFLYVTGQVTVRNMKGLEICSLKIKTAYNKK